MTKKELWDNYKMTFLKTKNCDKCNNKEITFITIKYYYNLDSYGSQNKDIKICKKCFIGD